MKEALVFMAHDSTRLNIERDISKEATGITKNMRRNKETHVTSEDIIRQKLARLTGDPHSSTGFVDIAAAEGGSIYFPPNEYKEKEIVYRSFLNQ